MMSYTLCASKSKGFSLLEMAVVLVILGLLLGSLLGPLSTQRQNKSLIQVKNQLNEIHDALMGYAAANGFLPCPAAANSSGLESRAGSGNCNTEHGFVPVVTLGLQGKTDSNLRVLDPWLVPIRYSLSSVGTWEYAQNINRNSTTADYEVCSSANCTEVLAQSVVAVVYSLGEFGNEATSSTDQLENTDNDTRFVSREVSEATGAEFNDTLKWISPNTLAYHLASAGHL